MFVKTPLIFQNDLSCQAGLRGPQRVPPFKLYQCFSPCAVIIITCSLILLLIRKNNDAESRELCSLTSSRRAGAVPAQQLLQRGSAGARADLPTPAL